MLVCPDSPYDEPHVQALLGSVERGSRRRFCAIDRTTMLQSVRALTSLVPGSTEEPEDGARALAKYYW